MARQSECSASKGARDSQEGVSHATSLQVVNSLVTQTTRSARQTDTGSAIGDPETLLKFLDKEYGNSLVRSRASRLTRSTKRADTARRIAQRAYGSPRHDSINARFGDLRVLAQPYSMARGAR
jgi:hypothetical protein